MRSIEDQLILHEGLKLKPYRCFGVTYEGLKLGVPQDGLPSTSCFGVTYEGLKPLDEHFRAHIRKQIKEVDTR